MQTRDLDTLIQQFAAGDRDPALLASLDAAAWECFHDPWEVRPEPAPGRLPEAPDPRMADLLTAFLDAQRWPYHQDEFGGFRCTPHCLGMDGEDLTLRLSVERHRRDHLLLQVTSAWTVPEDSRRDACGFCDKWNRAGRCLGASLEMPLAPPGQPRPREGALVLFHQLALPPRLTMKALVGHLDQCLAEAADFWFMARAWAEGWGRDA